MSITLVLVAAFAIKHFFADFVFQTAYQLHNKGRLGHAGGLLHVGIHVLMSLLVLSLLLPAPLWAMPILTVLVGEAAIHYTMDYTKCAVVRHYVLGTTNPYYWWLTGFDQLVHGLTYVWMINHVL